MCLKVKEKILMGKWNSLVIVVHIVCACVRVQCQLKFYCRSIVPPWYAFIENMHVGIVEKITIKILSAWCERKFIFFFLWWQLWLRSFLTVMPYCFWEQSKLLPGSSNKDISSVEWIELGIVWLENQCQPLASQDYL